MINKLVDQVPLLQVGNDMLQQATDAFGMLANANTELNHRRRELQWFQAGTNLSVF